MLSSEYHVFFKNSGKHKLKHFLLKGGKKEGRNRWTTSVKEMCNDSIFSWMFLRQLYGRADTRYHIKLSMQVTYFVSRHPKSHERYVFENKGWFIFFLFLPSFFSLFFLAFLGSLLFIIIFFFVFIIWKTSHTGKKLRFMILIIRNTS